MSEAAAPELRDAPGQPNGNSLGGANNTVYSSAKSAMDTVQNHPMTQNVTNGPVGEKVKEEHAKTASEFRDLADSRQTPEYPAATGQPLTHYHSLFYRLLSWKNPRATAISFVSMVLVIFASRYLSILRYVFKGLYTVLGITAAAEIAGKTAFGNGFTSQMRPKKYITVPKDSLERFTTDVEQLINFFVIEFQRIVFAENVYVTVAAFFSAFSSYYLIKWLPLWGLSLLATCITYLSPLIYIKNKDVIDAQVNQANDIVSKQAASVRQMTGQYTSKAQEQARIYANQAHEKTLNLVGQAKQKTGYAQSDYPKAPAADPMPDAPKTEPTAEGAPEPVVAEAQRVKTDIEDVISEMKEEGLEPEELRRVQTAMEQAVEVVTDMGMFYDEGVGLEGIDLHDFEQDFKNEIVQERRMSLAPVLQYEQDTPIQPQLRDLEKTTSAPTIIADKTLDDGSEGRLERQSTSVTI